MKKLLFIVSLLALIGSSRITRAQSVIYASFSPADLGLGYRIDNRIGDYGIYTTISRGNYKFADNWYIKDHSKISFGGILYTKEQSFFTLGVCGHIYGEVKTPYEMTKRALSPVSFEVGTGVSLNRFTTGIRLDPIKWDVAVDFGIKF